MKRPKSFLAVIIAWARSGFRHSSSNAPLRLGHQSSLLETPQQQQLYERLKSQLMFGALGELLAISPDDFQCPVFRTRLLLLKLSALVQNGDVTEARVISGLLMTLSCRKEDLARYLMSAVVFSQAGLSFRLGQEEKAQQQYVDGLRILQIGIDEKLMAQAWLAQRKAAFFSQVTCV